MIQVTHSTKVSHLSPDKIWKTWTNVGRWSKWQSDIEYAELTGDFAANSLIKFKLKNGPLIKLHLTEVKEGFSFCDVTNFPLAKMFDNHEIIVHENSEVELKTTLTMKGPLAFLWNKIVMKDIHKNLPDQMKALIDFTEQNNV